MELQLRDDIASHYNAVLSVQAQIKQLEAQLSENNENLQKVCTHNRVVMARHKGLSDSEPLYNARCLICGQQERVLNEPLVRLGGKPILWVDPAEYNQKFFGWQETLSLEAIERLGMFECGNDSRQFLFESVDDIYTGKCGRFEEFELIFYVLQDGKENMYEYKISASDERDAIANAPAQLAAAEQHIGKMAHNPVLVKVLSRPILSR